jgi:hypothetical protein
MYGILVSYSEYKERKENRLKYSKFNIANFIDEDTIVFSDGDIISNEIHGIFTGRDGEFVIVGKMLKSIDKYNKEPLIVPELSQTDEIIVRTSVENSYGFKGDFHYYFVNHP